MDTIKSLIPPDTSTENKQHIEDQLINSARKILYIHYSHYNRIDQKAQRFLTLMGAVEGYFIINFFLNRKFDMSDISWLIMLLALIIGAVIIMLYINILQSRPFYNGPNIEAQANDFRPNGNSEELRKDTLATLKISYQENVKIINRKSKLFKSSIRGICLYFITLACYFATLKANEKDIPNDILLWSTPIMSTHTQRSDELLTTDNVGAVEANDTEIAEVEKENTQEELQEQTTTSTTLNQPSQPQQNTLNSDNLDISETTPQNEDA